MRLRILGLLLLSLTLPATASAEDVVLRPAVPTNRVVVYLHGSFGHAYDIEHMISPLTEELLGRGFAVASSEAGGQQSWGNAASVNDYEHLIDRLPYERVYLLGGSMGGLATMQLLGRVHPEAVAMFAPVCDIDTVASWLWPYVTRQWGESWPDDLSPVVPAPEPGLPVIIWASPEDTVVPMEENASVCARELRNRGARVHQEAATGDHGDPSLFRPRWLAGFFSRSRGPQPRVSVRQH